MDHLEKLRKLCENIETVILGKTAVVERVMIALLAKGHVLLEDVPGVGKTILSRALAQSIDGTFSRIQMTPDLLPSDILGVSVYDTETGHFIFKKGPIFSNIVLADEINRTTPRTQSALLEAMDETQVSTDGKTYPLGPPFMVLATQNPYEFEGTYFLPESQLDRFMLRLKIGYPDKNSERDILRFQPSKTRLQNIQPVMAMKDLMALQDQVNTVRMDDAILDYILAISEATRRSEELTVGLSPRGALSLSQASKAAALLAGREYVVPDDVKTLAVEVVTHRLQTRSLAQGASAAEAIFTKILETVPVPE
jgi:MoxR-like ATPase